jgi:23S rRNA U2552 (ribose-2'-O)-methylase RlmE/FtsJ
MVESLSRFVNVIRMHMSSIQNTRGEKHDTVTEDSMPPRKKAHAGNGATVGEAYRPDITGGTAGHDTDLKSNDGTNVLESIGKSAGKCARDTACSIDCILQVSSTTQLTRLCEYFDDVDIHRIVFPCPYPCAEGIENVSGPKVSRKFSGSSFLQFSGISSPPKAWVQWMSGSFVRYVVMRMYFLDGGERGRKQSAGSLDELVEQLIDHAQRQPPEGPVRIQCGPRSMEKILLDKFEELDSCPFEFHPVNPTSTLHIFQHKTDSSVTFRWSFRAVEEQFYTSPDGPRRIPGQFCRAAGKLHEALIVSGFSKEAGKIIGSDDVSIEGVAVDVGAAPGGWTHQLAQDLETVIAIDPAELNDTVTALKNVYHVKKTSQNAGEDLEKILGEEKISLLTCDANRHPSFIGEMLAPVLKFMKPGALMVITLKFHSRGEQVNKDASKAMKELIESFQKFGYDATDPRTVWLLSNTASEKTVLCRTK